MTVRWGVAGPGHIARKFAEGMRLVDDGEIVAVASRSMDRADRFGDEFDVSRRYADHRLLAEDPEVDIVYVATPHARHHAETVRFLEAGKHVLCEKPLALNASQATDMRDTARRQHRFLMEAMWSRFLPAYRTLRDVLDQNRIGTPLLVEADFGFRMAVDPNHRLFDRQQGGGALLDLGIYPVQLATLVLGIPDRVTADGHVGDTGVDESVAAILGYPGEQLAVAKASIRTPMACTARIAGTGGIIDIPAFMHRPSWIDLTIDGRTERLDASFEGEGLRFQVHEVHRCLADGRRESPVMPLDETVAIAGLLDEVRSQIGMTYPGE
jgi:predicted dehydrogenase